MPAARGVVAVVKTRVECINCKKVKRKDIVMLQMHILVCDSTYSEEGEWEEVERVPVCLKCLDNPVTAATAVHYLRGVE